MSDTEQATPRRIKLRRVKPSPPQEIIQQNLLPLKENIRKKQRAQEAYYETHDNDVGASPLTRAYKRPVHQRLGRKIRFNGTNTSSIPPKRKLRRVGTFGNPQQMRRERIFSAQQRINRIRAQQRGDMLNGRSFTPKKIKLRRTLPQRFGVATNLQVQVKNNHAFLNVPGHIKRFRQALDQQLQLEIKKIQVEYGSVNQQPIMSVTPVTTTLTMHNRFAALS